MKGKSDPEVMRQQRTEVDGLINDKKIDIELNLRSPQHGQRPEPSAFPGGTTKLLNLDGS